MLHDQQEREAPVTEMNTPTTEPQPTTGDRAVDLSGLHRLRTDLPESEFLAEPPRIPVEYLQGTGGITLRVADPETDAETVSVWMSRQHLVETWDQAWNPGEWAADWRAKLSTTYAVPLILSYGTGDDREEVGYMEIYRPRRDEIGLAYLSEPHDLGFHVAVGEPALTGRGIFGPFVGDFASRLLQSDPECRLVIAEPDVNNHRVHRVMSRGGGVDAGQWQQRADRRVRLFFWPGAGVDPRSRLKGDPEDGDLV
jgi:RimJ/RimL family protein N-acetyltransferase